MAEPTVLIKKADGTSERVPLSLLRKKTSENTTPPTPNNPIPTEEKISQPATSDQKPVLDVSSESSDAAEPKEFVPPNSEHRSAPQTPNPAPTKKQTFLTAPPDHDTPRQTDVSSKSDLPMEESPHELATTTPVSDYFTDLAKAHEWNERDHRSPLEETINHEDVTNPLSTTMPSARFEDVTMVTKKLSFSIPVDLESRLHSLIQSRLKDIRSDEQVIDYATRPTEHGGLALTSEQAQELIQVIQTSLETSRQEHIPAPRRTVQQTPSAQKTSTIFADAPTMSPSSVGKDTSFTDIHAPEPLQKIVGPLEEIGQITLTDFRRYGKDPAKATAILKAKITVIRDESYLEFQKVKVAWTQSPLYGQYLSHIAQSLSEKTPLAISDSDDMSPDDMKEIAVFSAMLRM
ncbi:MAG: hypothetical protein CO029_01935 [Candidatus Magasanikbacteria bacterium CG_4_9_14_0_2_um_filter_41_10]|uniref:Uncharacterized protein n=1 Tax=Candidatus Magasanikbacteria bacterium CG_4_10_14_0_2_um_filter_41_31 TaxID=1974639 RepID=A0A2M7V5J7_9BACT|nr:MAG: hypothetical protein AUJ37_02065 [Candidatus Magasanikbacteria bacterium CG1_02_41_34]PIZ93884.1 MAG: hypothetical protein COX83_00765 [Candidatus Magasanikbacteria bacterium CG_4_10_14_0_2_um_filter_41_31]PJC53596.1 MAG: hypothetical protein CO029_01935 [Candidatus Magasanikbacteria bacterium CG_4_9_14_0_2_um_filter_41_10]